MDEGIYSSDDEQIFFKRDKNCVYCKVKIEDTDRDKSAFMLDQRLCRFLRMQLRVEPRTWKPSTNNVCDIITDKITICPKNISMESSYFPCNADEHIWHGLPVLSPLQKAGVVLDLK